MENESIQIRLKLLPRNALEGSLDGSLNVAEPSLDVIDMERSPCIFSLLVIHGEMIVAFGRMGVGIGRIGHQEALLLDVFPDEIRYLLR